MNRFIVALVPVVHVSSLAPLLGDGSDADWWFAYKLNTASFPGCSSTRECIFGGELQDYPYGYGQHYLLASSTNGVTSEMELKSDCLGMGDDPLAKTFAQIYGGSAPNYVIWNGQLYLDPNITLSPPCSTYSSTPTSCSAPWGHSKGAMAWDSDGVGFVLQVTTPDWPGSGDPAYPRTLQGNTLGCVVDDNIEVAQHFFALRLSSAADTKDVLLALQKASVVTDPSNGQLVKLSDSPAELATLANGLAQLDTSVVPFQSTLSSSVKLLAKPQALHVPVWQLVSSLVGEPLRTATWWTNPAVPSALAGTPGCWSSELGTPSEVQIATSGQWQGTNFSLEGGLGQDYNHAKLGHSLGGSLAIMGDMNQQGSYSPEMRKCNSSQNGRGGIFFVVDDSVLHAGLVQLMTGDTAQYYGDITTTTRGPAPPPTPSGSCGGGGVDSRTCRSADMKGKFGCVYVYSADKAACGVNNWGCFPKADLPAGCPEASSSILETLV